MKYIVHALGGIKLIPTSWGFIGLRKDSPQTIWLYVVDKKLGRSKFVSDVWFSSEKVRNKTLKIRKMIKQIIKIESIKDIKKEDIPHWLRCAGGPFGSFTINNRYYPHAIVTTRYASDFSLIYDLRFFNKKLRIVSKKN